MLKYLKKYENKQKKKKKKKKTIAGITYGNLYLKELLS